MSQLLIQQLVQEIRSNPYTLKLNEIEVKNEADPPGFQTRFKKLNDKTNGLHLGDVVTIAAKSGRGKTTFCKQIIYDLIKQYNLKVGLFLLEDRIKDVVRSFVCLEAGVSLNRYRYGKETISDEHFYALQSFFNNNIIIAKPYLKYTITKVSQIIEDMINDGCKVIVLDNTTLILGTSNESDSFKATEEAVREFARLTKQNDILFISITQVHKNSKILSMDNVKGSGAITANSDVVLLLNTNEGVDGILTTDILIDKNRGGASLGTADTYKMLPTGHLSTCDKCPIITEDSDF